QAGPVIKVKIPKDRDGRPKQFAFVNFKHEESVPYGLSLLNGIKLYGRPIKIQFRSGSSHASQDGNPACSPHGAATASPPGAPHPASNCSRYEPVGTRSSIVFSYEHGKDPARRGGESAAKRATPARPRQFLPAAVSSGWRRAGGFVSNGRKATRCERPVDCNSLVFKAKIPDLFFLQIREEFRRGKREEYGFEERGHDAGAEHHYREPAYEDRHRDGWSHDYDYRRESYREAKWHLSRH
ncbi:RBM7 protein, partial [Hydrobates tethys]|nr:RBM7 protein [Oceanodroma tethys]